MAQPQSQTQQRSDSYYVAEIAVILGTALSATLAFGSLLKLLRLATVPLNIASSALMLVLKITDSFPRPPMEGLGEAQREILRINAERRASYVLAAYRRVLRSIQHAMARGASLEEATAAAESQERTYFSQHVRADAQRVVAASKIDALAEQYGPVLGWYAVNDQRTTSECRAASGKNFSALVPPAIGWPGIVHVHCRCQPGKPHRGARMLA